MSNTNILPYVLFVALLFVTMLQPSLAQPPIYHRTIDIAAWDVNCSQHIHRRVPESKCDSEIERLKRGIDALKARLGDVA